MRRTQIPQLQAQQHPSSKVEASPDLPTAVKIETARSRAREPAITEKRRYRKPRFVCKGQKFIRTYMATLRPPLEAHAKSNVRVSMPNTLSDVSVSTPTG